MAFDPVALEDGTAELRRVAPGAPIESAASAADACVGTDAVVVATEWPEFAELPWSSIAPTMVGSVVVDGRRIVDPRAAHAAGLRVVALGVETVGAVLQPAD